jgi:hypothetical protein
MPGILPDPDKPFSFSARDGAWENQDIAGKSFNRKKEMRGE